MNTKIAQASMRNIESIVYPTNLVQCKLNDIISHDYVSKTRTDSASYTDFWFSTNIRLTIFVSRDPLLLSEGLNGLECYIRLKDKCR